MKLLTSSLSILAHLFAAVSANNFDSFCSGTGKLDCDKLEHLNTDTSSTCGGFSLCEPPPNSASSTTSATSAVCRGGSWGCSDFLTKQECQEVNECRWINPDGFVGNMKDFFANDYELEDFYLSVNWRDFKTCQRGCLYASLGLGSLFALQAYTMLRGFVRNVLWQPFTCLTVLEAFLTCWVEVAFGVLSFSKVAYYWNGENVMDGGVLLTDGHKVWLVCTGFAALVGGSMESTVYRDAALQNQDSWPKNFLASSAMGHRILAVTSAQVFLGFYPALATLATTTLSWGWIFWIAYLLFANYVYILAKNCRSKREEQGSLQAKLSSVRRSRWAEMTLIGVPLMILDAMTEEGFQKLNMLAVWIIIRDIIEFYHKYSEVFASGRCVSNDNQVTRSELSRAKTEFMHDIDTERDEEVATNSHVADR